MNKKAEERSGNYREGLVERLRDPEEAAAYLNAVLEDDAGPEVFLLALRDVADAHGLSRLAEESGLKRQSIYRALSEEGNPRLASLTALFRALNLQFAVKARAA